LTPINEKALERASKNKYKGKRRARKDLEPDVTDLEPATDYTPVSAPSSVRILIAQIPKAGGRWHQVHFNRDVIDQFFKIKPNTPQRVFLTEVLDDGSRGVPEQRPCVFSDSSNRNLKIELHSKATESYPTSGQRPIAIFKEIQLRTFDYLVLMPDDKEYSSLDNYITNAPTIGKGVRRTITDEGKLREVWPECPLL